MWLIAVYRQDPQQPVHATYVDKLKIELRQVTKLGQCNSGILENFKSVMF